MRIQTGETYITAPQLRKRFGGLAARLTDRVLLTGGLIAKSYFHAAPGRFPPRCSLKNKRPSAADTQLSSAGRPTTKARRVATHKLRSDQFLGLCKSQQSQRDHDT